MSKLINWIAVGLLIIASFEAVMIDGLYSELMTAIHEIQYLTSDDPPATQGTVWVTKPLRGVSVERAQREVIQ